MMKAAQLGRTNHTAKAVANSGRDCSISSNMHSRYMLLRR